MSTHKSEEGFTLIEIIAILILIAMLSAVAVSRMTSTADVDLKAKAEVVRGHIRYAQMRAMNADASDTSTCSASFGIRILGNAYFMFNNCNVADKVILPGADTVDVLFALTPSNTYVTFDKWGRPCSDEHGQTLYAADKDLTLGTETIRITKNTGYVP